MSQYSNHNVSPDSSVDLSGPSPLTRSRSASVSKPVAVFENGKSYNKEDAKYESLVRTKAKAITAISTKGRTPWSLFNLEKLYDEAGVTIDVRMVCVTCTCSLTTSNPSQSFRNHLNADRTGCNTMSKVHRYASPCLRIPLQFAYPQ
jgi:hypothetical protein